MSLKLQQCPQKWRSYDEKRANDSEATGERHKHPDQMAVS